MATFAISTIKDEADVVAGMLLHLADEVDAMLVIDNASTDGTREILAELEDQLPLTVIDDDEVGYYQSERMSRLAEKAAGMGAVWIVPVDADELWCYRGDRIRDELRRCKADIVEADLFNHFPTAVDPAGDDPFRTIVWRQAAVAPLPKVAFKWRPGAVIHQGNHGVTLPGATSTKAHGLDVRHFPYRSAEQFVRKARNGAAAYRATDLPQHIGAHWRSYGDLIDRFGEEQVIDEVFRRYFWFLSPIDEGLVPDPAPYLRWRS